MAIAAYTGLPGHGKSYGVVENVIAPALKAKRDVFTNIPLNTEECIKRFGVSATQFEIQDIIDDNNWWKTTFRAGAIIVIDELWRLWPSGLKANNVREGDKEFLAEHRHLVGENGKSTEIIFVTQDLSQIASFARSLVETTYRVTKLSKLGMEKKYRVDVYFGSVTGVNPPRSKRDREIYGKFKDDIKALYISHTKSATGEAGDESRVDTRFNIFKGKGIKIFLILLICLILGVWKGFSILFGNYDQQAEISTNSTENTQPIDQPQKPPKRKVFKFLSDAEVIIITFNNGIWPEIEYRYKVVFEHSQTTLDFSAMQRLGYELEPVNECMVKIKGADFNGFALCQIPEESPDWIDQFASSATDTLSNE